MAKHKITSKKEGTGKKGIVKDDNGYYKIILGAVNTYNASGIFYKINDITSITEAEDSILKMRLDDGLLRAEYKHPPQDGMSNKDYINRLVTIDMDRVCAHIKAVEFVNTGKTEDGWEGYPIYITVGWVKPTGPFGKFLAEYLENEDENVSFSIRSILKAYWVGKIFVRDLSVGQVSTWDFVGEHGIQARKQSGVLGATQWSAAGIEGLDGIEAMDGNEMTACIGDACIPKIKELTHGHENAEYFKAVVSKLQNQVESEPSIFNW